MTPVFTLLTNYKQSRAVRSVNCTNRNEQTSPDVEVIAERVSQGIRMTMIVALMKASPVFAAERSWRPRRHHFRIGEEYIPRPFSSKKLVKTNKSVKKSGREQMKAKNGKVKELTLAMKSPPMTYQPVTSAPFRYFEHKNLNSISKGGIILILFAALWIVFKKLRQVMRNHHWKDFSTKHKQGRWIHDRSLGGKKIFLEHNTPELNPLEEDEGHVIELKHKEKDKFEEFPTWWHHGVHIYIPEATKSESKVEAQKILRHLENSRFAAKDYSLDVVVTLYRICVDACIVVRPYSQSIAISIYRYAVRQTIMLVSEGIEGLGGYASTEFVSRLAYVLSLNFDVAIAVVHTEASAKTRSLLLQLFVDVRNTGSSTYTLRAFSNLLKTFPLPETNAELIGFSMTSTTTEQERYNMYKVLVETNPDLKVLIEKLLGKIDVL